MRGQLHLLALTFELIESHAAAAEESGFTKNVIEYLLTICNSPSVYVNRVVEECIYRGLARLMISFSLSHSYRERISHLAANKFPHASGTLLLHNLALTTACLY